jgi:hypothetical protein
VAGADRGRRGANPTGVQDSVSPPSLRPLGLGELLDRAVTLCVRYATPFSLIYLAYGVPLGVINYFSSRGMTSFIQAFSDQMKAQSTGHQADPHALSAAFANAGNNGVWTAVLFLFVFFISPLVTGGLIEATSEAYFGRLPTFARAYRVALERWANLVGINVLYGLAAGALYLIVVIILFVVALGVIGIGSAAHAAGIAIGVVVGGIFAVAIFLLALVIAIAYQMSYFACVIERSNFVVSFTSGLGRVFNGIGLKRALLVGLAYVAVAIGITIVSSVGEVVLVGLLRSTIAGAIFRVVIALATAAFLTAFMSAFYFDLRVREEGLDLQLAAQATLDRPLEGV